MIHQELNPIPDMSVAEKYNFLGKEKRKWIFTSKKEQEKSQKDIWICWESIWNRLY